MNDCRVSLGVVLDENVKVATARSAISDQRPWLCNHPQEGQKSYY